MPFKRTPPLYNYFSNNSRADIKGYNNIDELPILSWRMASQLLYSNWINYYVYQESPYLISAIGEE